MPSIVAGMAKLTQQLEEVGLSVTPEDLLPGAQIIFDRSQELCPVDTGFLRDSGHVDLKEDDVEIAYDAIYASYQEFGTYKMEAQPFLRPAIDEMELEALSAIVDHIEAGFRDITQ